MSISDAVRKRVTERANKRCEYCQIAAEVVLAPMEIDHIMPLAQGRDDDESNLCYACPRCNGSKHATTDAVDPLTGENVDLFNPRKQVWTEHFTWADDNATILGVTACGRVTIDVLKINRVENLSFRKLMASIGSYPPDLNFD